MKISNDHGMAMPFTLFVVVTLAVLEIAFLGSSLSGALSVRKELNRTQSLAAAESAAHLGLQRIDDLINGTLSTNISTTDSTVVIRDARDAKNHADGISWLVENINHASVVLDGCSGSDDWYRKHPGRTSCRTGHR